MAYGKSWGPSTWYIFHCLALSWSTENQQKYNTFFKIARSIIPCEICKKHFTRAINRPQNRIQHNCSNKDKMFKWTVRLHNNVNRMNRKRIIKPDTAMKIYIKNDNLIINNGKIIKFLREFIAYNFRFGGWRRYNALKLLRILVDIYPSPQKKKTTKRKIFKKSTYT